MFPSAATIPSSVQDIQAAPCLLCSPVSFDEFWKCFNQLIVPRRRLSYAGLDPKPQRMFEKVIGFLDFNILSHLKFFNHKLNDVARRNFYMERGSAELAAMLGLASPPLSESSSRSVRQKATKGPPAVQRRGRLRRLISHFGWTRTHMSAALLRRPSQRPIPAALAPAAITSRYAALRPPACSQSSNGPGLNPKRRANR